jgi:GxxExxY protein
MDDRDPQTFAILGAAFEVRRHLSGGFLESLYCVAVRIEFGLRQIPFEVEPDWVVHYKTHRIGCFRPDFLCYGDVIIEVKARPAITGADIAQALSYVTASGASRALLLNFGAARLEFRRLVGPNWHGPASP